MQMFPCGELRQAAKRELNSLVLVVGQGRWPPLNQIPELRLGPNSLNQHKLGFAQFPQIITEDLGI